MKIVYFISLCFLVLACSHEEDIDTEHSAPSTIAEINHVQTLFDTDKFDNKLHSKLLKELKICDQFQTDTSNYLKPACSPRFFRILPMRDDVDENNALLLQIKSKVGGIKLRRLITFVRERGQLVKVNGFVANLIATRKSTSHYYDLILRFNDIIDGELVFYNCLFVWNGTKYVFKTVELIEGSTWRQRIIPEFKDSVSNDIYKTLLKNEMIL
jgi:hypothetical protein